LYWYRRNIF